MYLPRIDLELFPVDNTEEMEEDEEPMDYDSSICSEDCRIQPLGKLYCKEVV